MKILHVYKDFDPPVKGGMERHIALMCRFQRHWAEVEALVCSRSWKTERAVVDGIPVTRVGEWGRVQSAPLSPLFPYYMRKIKADVVVVHVPNPTAELGWLLARPRGALVVRYHSDVVRQAAAMRVYGPMQMHFLRQARVILPTSEPYVQSSPVLSKLSSRCRVVPLGILPETFQNPDWGRVEALRAQHGADFVLFSGRHRYYKGLRHLVEAAPRIRAKVVIAGDGPEREACMALAQRLNVDVAFVGALSDEDVVNYLHACALFVFPSIARSEAFGISIMEAHACGKPVVATTLGTGVEFINQHGRTGLNVPPGDAEALAEAVNRLLSDTELREAMGDYARQRIGREFHAATVARREFDLYQEACPCKTSM